MGKAGRQLFLVATIMSVCYCGGPIEMPIKASLAHQDSKGEYPGSARNRGMQLAWLHGPNMKHTVLAPSLYGNGIRGVLGQEYAGSQLNLASTKSHYLTVVRGKEALRLRGGSQVQPF
jgi:hypothetical protein